MPIFRTREHILKRHPDISSQKQYIGKLSAFCGAVSASCAAGAGITYMGGGELSVIKKTIENTLANIPGIICDGAKISCAAKIAAREASCLLQKEVVFFLLLQVFLPDIII